MNQDVIFPVLLSLKCAVLSALLNLPWGIFWGWLLARQNFRGKIFVQTLLFVPLVLPPVLTGYFLLTILSKNSFFGRWLWEVCQMRFVLDWKGAVVAAAVVASPFMIQAVKQAMESVDRRLELVARGLGASRLRAALENLARPSSSREISHGRLKRFLWRFTARFI